MSDDVEVLAERIAEGRVKHGVGASEDFPGNVSHLVSPIVGTLRLRERDTVPITLGDIRWFIDRLSLVLDMARHEAEITDERLAADRATHLRAGAEQAERLLAPLIEHGEKVRERVEALADECASSDCIHLNTLWGRLRAALDPADEEGEGRGRAGEHECGRDFDPGCSGCVTAMSDAYGSDRSRWPL
ncbi:MAG TPA: hypothetical protein VJU80_09060 [Solirubrobacteraceae bacterium]|nr:hypothetical protein [Solirubrobacteraceae bacterium]